MKRYSVKAVGTSPGLQGQRGNVFHEFLQRGGCAMNVSSVLKGKTADDPPREAYANVPEWTRFTSRAYFQDEKMVSGGWN